MNETGPKDLKKQIRLSASVKLAARKPLKTPELVESFRAALDGAGISPEDVRSALKETRDEMEAERSGSLSAKQ